MDRPKNGSILTAAPTPDQANSELLASALPAEGPAYYPRVDGKQCSDDVDFEIFSDERPPATQYNFIVVGPTGVGKSTFVQYMTKNKTKEMKGHGAGTMSKTTEEKTIPSTVFYSNDEQNGLTEIAFTFTDTRGFGAHDMNEESIFESLKTEILKNSALQVNCIIIVHKMERFQKSTKKSLHKLLNLFKQFDVDANVHTLLVITHSGIYSEKVREEYKHDLCNQLQDFVSKDNVIHANFVKSDELDPQFRTVYQNIMRKDKQRLREKLIRYRVPFDPGIFLAKVLQKETLEQKVKKTALYKFLRKEPMVGILCFLTLTWLAVITSSGGSSSAPLSFSVLAGMALSVFTFLLVQ